jgi:hypothetical protein
MDTTYDRTAVMPHERDKLSEAVTALKNGNRAHAYQLSLELTRANPNNVDAWLLRSRTAQSTEEIMYSVSQVNRINPGHPATKTYAYQTMWKMLEHDPFLAYMDESDELYYIRNKEYMSLVVPKDRNVPEKYPPTEPQPLAPAYRFLLLALFGMVFSGIGTFVFAPLAVLSALNARRKGLDKQDRVRVRVVMWLAVLLMAPAALLVLIFALHFRGF